MRIGFVGAGQMGMPMVERLVAAGHDVVVAARRPEARTAASTAGASATAVIIEAAAGADAVVLCLYADDQVRELTLGPSSLLDAMAPNALLVIHTTCSPATASLLAERGAVRGIRVVEAPVSGSASDISEGHITVMLGGTDEHVEAARPVVAAYGDPILHLGPLGAAQAVKLLNNALLAANLQLVAEVERLAGALGADWSLTAAAIQSSSGASRAMGIVGSMGSVQAMVDAGGHFLVKDVAVVVASARELGLDLGVLESINRDGPLPFLAGAGGRAASATDREWRDIEAIKQLKARYFRLLDTKDWDAFADLFTEDCQHLLPTDDERPPVPNAQYLADIQRTLADAVTVHHGHMPEITLTGRDEAEGTWSMFDDVEIPRPGQPPMHLQGYGHYHETYRRCPDGQWRISSKRNIRLRVDHVPPAASGA